MSKIVSGVVKTRLEATRVIDRLVGAGFRQSEISVVMSDATRNRDFALSTGTKGPEGAAAGALGGGAIGAIVAGLTLAGSIVIPGVGLLVAGPLAAAIAGAGAGAAVGGAVGGLIGLGIPEHEVRVYEDALKQGGILIGVEAEGKRADVAREILKNADAEALSTA